MGSDNPDLSISRLNQLTKSEDYPLLIKHNPVSQEYRITDKNDADYQQQPRPLSAQCSSSPQLQDRGGKQQQNNNKQTNKSKEVLKASQLEHTADLSKDDNSGGQGSELQTLPHPRGGRGERGHHQH